MPQPLTADPNVYLKKQYICIPGPDRVDGKWGEEGAGVGGGGGKSHGSNSNICAIHS